MMEAILANENIPIGTVMLVTLFLGLKYLSGRDKLFQEIHSDTTTALRENTGAIKAMNETLVRMDETLERMDSGASGSVVGRRGGGMRMDDD